MSGTWWINESDLDKDQAIAIENMPDEASFLIRGPAGSGKTNILLLRAKWLLLKKRSHFKIVVFTRTLRDFIRAGCEEYGIPPENVVTSIQFLRELLEEYSVPYETSVDSTFEADRDLLAGKVQALIETRNIKNLFDALLVDECQDYSDTELLIIRRLSPRLVMAVDSRQSIYKSTQSPELLEKLVENQIITLKYHYRSGLRLCSVADAILRDSANFAPVKENCLYDESARPSSVDLIRCDSLEKQYEAIANRLHSQLDSYPGDLLGVLFPKKDQVLGFRDLLAQFDVNDIERIRVDTMHGGKGLEFRAVHIGGSESLYRMGSTQKRLIYTAILRGQTAAAIYYSDNIPGYLESALAVLSPPMSSPKLTDLFKK